MKRKIDKTAWEKLSEDLKANYKLVGTDYVLDLEDDEGGDDDKGAEKLRIERQHRRAAEKKAKDAEDKLAEIEDAANKKNNDVAAVEASWQKKYDKLKGEKDEAVASHQKYVKTNLADKQASDIANELSKTAPKILLPHIRSRLDVDFEGDEPRTIVLGADGKRSAMTVAELTKEFRDNKDYSAIVTVSQASGGGAPPSRDTKSKGGAVLAGQDNSGSQPASLATIKASDLADRIRQSGQAGRRRTEAA